MYEGIPEKRQFSRSIVVLNSTAIVHLLLETSNVVRTRRKWHFRIRVTSKMRCSSFPVSPPIITGHKKLSLVPCYRMRRHANVLNGYANKLCDFIWFDTNYIQLRGNCVSTWHCEHGQIANESEKNCGLMDIARVSGSSSTPLWNIEKCEIVCVWAAISVDGARHINGHNEFNRMSASVKWCIRVLWHE